jgi:hypothetical protein
MPHFIKKVASGMDQDPGFRSGEELFQFVSVKRQWNLLDSF